MQKNGKRKIAFVSSSLPRKCGIATFCSDLIRNISLASENNFEPLVVAMRNSENINFGSPVKFEIRKNVKNDYVCAADYLNFSHVDAVSVQHEFGLFGGDAGSYLNLLLNRVNAPIITTMHTVLREPDEHYRKATMDLCDVSHKVVVMNQEGVNMLKNIYSIPSSKISLLPHGIPDLPFVDSSYYKHNFGMDGRKTILTFGLLGRNKGIENALKALPNVVKKHPSVLYIVLGMTHPEVKKHEGESYRFKLQRMVKELGIQDNVIFHNRFVNDDELHNFLCAADIYVTPYLHKEQLTSGTLAFAVGTGKAVVSTPYWAAEELLSDGRGILVPFEDSNALSNAINNILENDTTFSNLRRNAYEYGRKITWPKIGEAYWKIFNSAKLPICSMAKPVATPQTSHDILEIPEPDLDHIVRLTDDTGMYQHAKYTIPNRSHGYCTDDNSRALITMVKYYSLYSDPKAYELLNTYLSFVLHAKRGDGTVRNFMTFDRKWFDSEPAHDSLGRVLWALGTLIATPPLPEYISIVKDYFDTSIKHVPNISPRGNAYAIFGMADYLKQFPGASEIKSCMQNAADKLVKLFEKNNKPDWQWFENIIAYDNAALCHSLFTAGMTLENSYFTELAQKTAEFLISKTFNGDHFSFIGCKGWYKIGKEKAQFDQQPIEAVSTVLMLHAAYEATGREKYLVLQRKAFDWFLGDNDLGIPIYDFKTKGCCDGLAQKGINLNQGAESTISFMMSLLCIIESFKIPTRSSKKIAKNRFDILNLTEPKQKVSRRKKITVETE